MSEKLKLLAETADDLLVISAALQDAIVRVGSLHFDTKARRFTLTANRYCHESNTPMRILSGLGIDNVLHAKAKGIRRSDPDAFLVLLAAEFEADAEPPGGILRLIFAGDGEMRLRVEALDVHLIDMSKARKTSHIPAHLVD